MVKRIINLLRENRTPNFFYILLGLLVLLSVLFLMGGNEGLPFTLGRIISFVIVISLAYSLIEWCSDIVEGSDQWVESENLDENINLRLQDISQLLERASERKKKSQEILHERLKKIFFLKFKEKRDLSDEDLKDMLKRPEEFRECVQDEVIADFILSTEKNSSETKLEDVDFLSSIHTKEKYKKKIKEIIKRIDQWEEREYG